MSSSIFYGGVHFLDCLDTYNLVFKLAQVVVRGERNTCALFGIDG